jgi:hypothetical protein
MAMVYALSTRVAQLLVSNSASGNILRLMGRLRGIGFSIQTYRQDFPVLGQTIKGSETTYLRKQSLCSAIAD